MRRDIHFLGLAAAGNPKLSPDRDFFEERRVAILHKAFEGELTLQWRAEHGVDMSSWRDVPLKDCGRWFGGGTPTTSKKSIGKDEIYHG